MPSGSAVHLSLLIGPVIPVPVPALMIDALDTATVTSAAGTPSGFQLRFKVNSKSELNTIFLIAVGQNTSVGTPPLRVSGHQRQGQQQLILDHIEHPKSAFGDQQGIKLLG